MAKKTVTVIINDGGDDKTFILTRLSARETEDWALQAFFAMANAGVEVPDDVRSLGFAGIATIGLQALGKIAYEKAKPLLDKMLECIAIVPDSKKPNVFRALIDSDVEDVTTYLLLRKEVFALHTDFLQTVEPSTTESAGTMVDGILTT